MINKEKFKCLFSVLRFEHVGDVFTKKFDDINAVLKVDFDKNELIYPEDKGLVVENKNNFYSYRRF